MKTRSIILDERAKALAAYPHAKQAGSFLFVSGVSSRRPDNTHEGVELLPDGSVRKDIRAQTKAVIENIGVILKAAGSDLDHVLDATVFLVDMADYAGMNEVYNRYFQALSGPARTTVAVHQLPHPNLLVEMKVIAVVPDARATTQEGPWLREELLVDPDPAAPSPREAHQTQQGPWLREGDKDV